MEGDGDGENLGDTPIVLSYDVQADSLGKFHNLIWISMIALGRYGWRRSGIAAITTHRRM